MAKWGEGDPRWIVEDRPDATNVNNWHWTEKNAAPWSKDRLKELLVGLDISDDQFMCKINELEKIKGEASANNRKGKLIFFYEWDLELNWEGKIRGKENGGSGKIEIPNLSEENSIDDIEITVTLKDTSDDAMLVKEFMHKVGRNIIRAQLGLYISSLREEFSKGMILPRKDGTSELKPDTVSNITSGFNKKIEVSAPISTEKIVGSAITSEVETIQMKQTFQCRAQELYDALTKVEMVMAFTRGAVTLEPVKNGKFVLFGGNISGEFVKLTPGKQIIQKWRYKRWPASHFSTVTIAIKEESDHTSLLLRQVGIPKGDVEMTKQNWERYYFESIKRTFGFGTFF